MIFCTKFQYTARQPSRYSAFIRSRGLMLSWRSVGGSHSIVVRSAAAFGCDPVDIAGAVLDITCFTVDTVLSVDLQPLRLAVLRRDEFVDT